jgi:hypothetical protein
MPRVSLAVLAAVLLSGVACESSISGADFTGPPYFHATIDGVAWSPTNVSAVCENYAMVIRAGRTLSGSATLFLTIGEMRSPGTFTITDVTTGRFAQIRDTLSTLLAQSSAQVPGTFKVSGLDEADSIVVGQFTVRLTSLGPPNQTLISGTFRLPYRIVGSANYPNGTPCYGGAT